MSTNLECEFIPVKTEEGVKWYYALEDWYAPKNAWDWHEYATAYGPFPSYDEADDHLINNHANPGGHSIADETPLEKLTDTLKQLFDEALEAQKKQAQSRYGW